ncbi:GNAT family N-acetyltransferase [Roseivivax sediminis]|nr:N-acetyltransferase [Roseivivax sediminis]
MVQQTIKNAQRDKVVIIPLCPFAKALIGRHPEWQDLLFPPQT